MKNMFDICKLQYYAQSNIFPNLDNFNKTHKLKYPKN